MTDEDRARKGRKYLRTIVEPAVKKIEEKVPQPGLELVVPPKMHREPSAGEYASKKGETILRRPERKAGMVAAEKYLSTAKRVGKGVLRRMIKRRFGI